MVSPAVQKHIIECYSNKKLSAKQIADMFSLSEAVVRYHLKKSKVPRRTISEAIYSLHETKFGKKRFSLKEKLSEKEKELKVAGTMLYWGEGAKTGNIVKFTNSDPEMVKTFLVFLREICGISESNLRALIHLYPDHNRKGVERFWTRLTDIPKENFYKSFVHEGKMGTYRNKSVYGTICINYADVRLLEQILAWVEEYKVQLNSSNRRLSSAG